MKGWRVQEVRELLSKHWKAKRDYYADKHVIAFRAGPIAGPGFVSVNAAQIKLHHNWSGSGPGSFNGAKDWPHLEIKIGFPEGTEEALPLLAAKFAKLIDEFMGEAENVK